MLSWGKGRFWRTLFQPALFGGVFSPEPIGFFVDFGLFPSSFFLFCFEHLLYPFHFGLLGFLARFFFVFDLLLEAVRFEINLPL